MVSQEAISEAKAAMKAKGNRLAHPPIEKGQELARVEVFRGMVAEYLNDVRYWLDSRSSAAALQRLTELEELLAIPEVTLIHHGKVFRQFTDDLAEWARECGTGADDYPIRRRQELMNTKTQSWHAL